ncbi:MAG: glycosyltransferase family 4 protein [Candidatus Uhrbacteria bacterium]
MKILITGTTGESMPPPYGGVPKVSLLYAREWKRMGHEVAITFVYRPETPDDLGANAKYYFEFSQKPNALIKLIFLLRYAFARPLLFAKLVSGYLKIYPRLKFEVFLYAAYGIYLDGVLKDFVPDLVLGEATLIKSYMAAQVAKLRGIPVVFDTYAEIHDQGMGVNKWLNRQQQKKYWESFLSLGELTITISNCCVGAQAYLPLEKVKVFYDTCDFSCFQVDVVERREQMRAQMSLPKDIFLVGTVGAFEHRKGHDHLIKAVALLVKKGCNVGAVICGGSGDETKWRELAIQEGVVDRIFFLKRISELELVTLHKSIDLYVNLSYTPRSCGLDLALLEGMAAAHPIIVYNYAGLPEAIPNGENGILVPVNDIPAVADAIQTISQLSVEQREYMGRMSREIALKSDIRNTAVIKLGWFNDILTQKHV